MGTLYRKYCPVCDSNSQATLTFEGFVGAVITNSNRGGQIVADGYVAYISDHGELVPLPHPLESDALKAAGGEWTEAAMHGRLLYVHHLVCPECGAQNTTATLVTGSTGCTTGLIFASIVLGCSLFVFRLHPIVGCILAWLALISPSTLIDKYIRTRYRDNVVPYQSHRCEQCDFGNLLSLSSAQKTPTVCPRCKQNTMTIEIAGRS